MPPEKLLLVPIVEGHGDQLAVPRLVGRWLRHRRFEPFFEVRQPAVRAPGVAALKAPHSDDSALGIEHFVQIALRARPHGLLVVLDADSECIRRQRERRTALGPELLARARQVAGPVPVAVVVANRSYEAWILAGLSRLRQQRRIPRGARLDAWIHPERRAGCKTALSELLGVPYEEMIHQADLTDDLPFTPAMARRAPSFGKLLRDLDRLACEMRAYGHQRQRDEARYGR